MKVSRLLAGLFVVMVLLMVFGDRGLLDYRVLREKHVALKEANECIVNENNELKREIGLLKGDVRYIETVARRELGMVREGDRVYQFID
ncbi:MAG: septum formation initiator family protein [Deltaproteobacteria bacterium]|nr:septum formation initiator family protein [Deltaproteobacteria bacterium]